MLKYLYKKVFTMIRNYIFDFGNVLGRYCPEEMTAAIVSDPAAAAVICPVVFDRLYWDKLDDGSISDDEVKAGICSRLEPLYHESACRIYDRWHTLMPPVPGMQELIADIKAAGGRLYLLSNISIGFAERYGEVDWIRELFSLFDGLVFSGPIGMAKPHREIFEYVLDHYGLRAEECVFIDDTPKNIAACEEVGIRSILFDGDADNVREILGLKFNTKDG